MEKAKDRRNGKEYSAGDVSKLDSALRQALKPHLRCLHCEAVAHFRSASKSGRGRRSRVAHFYALPHEVECKITRVYSDQDGESDRTVGVWERNGAKLVVVIPEMAVIEGEPDIVGSGDGDSEDRGRAGGERTRGPSTVSRGPQRLLEQLVLWPSFKTSSMMVRMPGNGRPEVAVHDAFVRFESADMTKHTGRWLGFWGIVKPWSTWRGHDTFFSNYGVSNKSFRIALQKQHIAAILYRYKLSSIDEMVGHYLLLFDYARESGSGRFIADVNSVNHIGFLRNEL